MDKIRVSVTLSDKMLKQIDAVSEDLGINRSATITLMANAYIRSNKTLSGMNDFSNQLKDLLNNSDVKL